MTKETWKEKIKILKKKEHKEYKNKNNGFFKSIFSVGIPSEKTLLKYKAAKEKALVAVILGGLLIEATFIYTLLTKSPLFKEGENLNEYTTQLDKNKETKNHVVLLDLDEEITLETWKKIENIFEGMRNDNTIKEIVLVLNTPGGSPTASDEIANYLKEYPKKVTGYIQTVAASGGYYIASSLKEIIANPNAIVGSIGVIMPKYNLKELSKKIGIEEDNITMGKFKSPISLLKPIEEKDKKYIVSHLMKPTYETFLNFVSKNRNIPLKELKENYAEGQIWSASHPFIKGKLVDKLSSITKLKKEIDNSYKEGVLFSHISLSNYGNSEGLFNIKLNMENKELSKILNRGILN